MLVRREDRIEGVFDHAVTDDECQPFEQPRPAGLERGQTVGVGQAERGVGKHVEGQAQPFHDFALVVAVLAGQPVHAARAGFEELLEVVAEATRLGVQPRAPGMVFQPSGRSVPGRPVRG